MPGKHATKVAKLRNTRPAADVSGSYGWTWNNMGVERVEQTRGGDGPEHAENYAAGRENGSSRITMRGIMSLVAPSVMRTPHYPAR